MDIPAGEFKARCLQLMDEVAETGLEVVVTKRGRPVARLVPVDAAPRAIFGCMAGSITITGDIVSGLEEPWEADQ